MKSLKFYSKLIILIAVIGALVWAFKDDGGYLIIGIKNIHFEAKLLLVILALCALWLALWFLKTVLRCLNLSLNWLNPWSKNKQENRNISSLNKGVLAWSEENINQARSNFAKCESLIHKLLSLKIASTAADHNTAKKIVQNLQNKYPEATLASNILFARTLLNAEKHQEAAKLINQLYDQHKNHETIIKLRKDVLIKTANWSELFNFSNKYRKYLSESEVITMWKGYISNINLADDLVKSWYKLSKDLSANPQIVILYAMRLQELGSSYEAEKVLNKAIKKNYTSELVIAYGRIRYQDQKQLQFLQSILNKQKDDPNLYNMLAQFSLNLNLNNQAKDYLLTGLNINPTNEAYRLLAITFIRLDEPQTAAKYLHRLIVV